MKKLSILAFIATSAIANAASIDHIMNYTPEYNANPALQGAINTTSTVNYNPAGLVRIEDGLYINGGLQYATGEYSTNYKGEQFKTDLASAVPNFSIVKKDGRQAFFWTVGGIAGGAGVEYKDGISKYALLQDQFSNIVVPGLVNLKDVKLSGTAKGENRYLQTTLGTAWEIDSQWSVSGGIRLVHGQRNFKGTLNVEDAKGVIGNGLNGTANADIEREAFGLGFQLGLNYAATDRLNIGMRYDSKVRMNFETKDSGDNTSTVLGGGLGFGDFYPEYIDGAKSRRDLPAILALGASYDVTDRWTTFVGGNYYFNNSADMDKIVENGASRRYSNGYEVSVGSEYAINQKWSWLAGANYAVTGAKEANYHDSEYALDSIMLGTGAKYKYNDNLLLTGSVAHYMYDTTKSEGVTYKKDTTALGLGFTYKWN